MVAGCPHGQMVALSTEHQYCSTRAIAFSESAQYFTTCTEKTAHLSVSGINETTSILALKL
jgi:hypothetical protein